MVCFHQYRVKGSRCLGEIQVRGFRASGVLEIQATGRPG